MIDTTSDFIERLSQRLEQEEGCELFLYDCPAGYKTLGIGRNVESRGITKAEALTMLETDINIVISELDDAFPWWNDLSENRRIALADLAFNLGMPKLKAFKKCLQYLEGGDYENSALELLDSNYAKQVTNRANRNAELIREG